MKLFLVTAGTRHVVINIPEGLIGDEREYVKRESFRILYGNPDNYTVEPLTNHGDLVCFHLVGEAMSDLITRRVREAHQELDYKGRVEAEEIRAEQEREGDADDPQPRLELLTESEADQLG